MNHSACQNISQIWTKINVGIEQCKVSILRVGVESSEHRTYFPIIDVDKQQKDKFKKIFF